MASMNISLTDTLKHFVEERVNSGTYAGTSEYVRDLIRRDYDRQEKLARMQELWTEGLESGVSDKTIDEIFEDAVKRHKEKQKNAEPIRTIDRSAG